MYFNNILPQTALLLLISTILMTTYGNNCCMPPWTGFQGSCYQFFVGKMTHQNAEDHCQSLSTSARQSHLASITSEAESSFVRDYVKKVWPQWKTKDPPDIWIGYNDKQNEGKWKWTDGEKLTSYVPWRPNQPDNWENEDCATLWVSTGEWNDLSCDRGQDNKEPFICEIPQRASLSQMK